MRQSAIEHEISNIGRNFINWLRSHDRGVLLGLLFSITPFPVASLLGTLIDLTNLVLVRTGRLRSGEARLISISLLIAIVNTILVSWLILAIYAFLSTRYSPLTGESIILHGLRYFPNPPKWFLDLVNWIFPTGLKYV